MDRQHYRHELLQQRVQEWGMNVESLSRRLGVEPARLNAALHGKSTCFETLHKLADALGISMLELLRTDPAPAASPDGESSARGDGPVLTREAELLIAADQALKLARAALQSADAALAAQQELLRTNPLEIPTDDSITPQAGKKRAPKTPSTKSPAAGTQRMKERLVAHRDRAWPTPTGQDRPHDPPHDPPRQKAIRL